MVYLQRQALRVGAVGGSRELMGPIFIGGARHKIFTAERLPYLLRTQLFTADICLRLHDLAELDLQPTRQSELVVALQQNRPRRPSPTGC